ncbi:MAG: hypothetical protein HYY65_00590 [Candidatus Tectomicrobia bacterium]|uniref:Uncharacterized protein n=1 Tax=Tectimicrobiota bacterium TaxID=2528274 RepID=A0A932GMG5_UNCTE|nr:hypothetical protein [Candidatus Tectomicrobia bacterium]
MKILKRKNRIYDTGKFGQPQIRVYHKAGKGKMCPRYLLKCGCCEEKLQIFYSEDGLEIGGVNGAIEDWKEILLPLLQLNARKGGRRTAKGKNIRRARALTPSKGASRYR